MFPNCLPYVLSRHGQCSLMVYLMCPLWHGQCSLTVYLMCSPGMDNVTVFIIELEGTVGTQEALLVVVDTAHMGA